VLSRSPSFAALFTARSLSLLGDGIGSLALIIHVQEDRGTGTAVALLLFVVSLPRVVSPLAGVIADRIDQRTVIAGGEIAQGALMGIAAIWLPPLPVLLGLLLGKAMVATISEPAVQSAVPALVDDGDLPGANALLGGLREAGEVLGPLLGGVIVAVAGVRTGLAVDALTFLVSIPLLARVPSLPPEPSDGTPHELGTAVWEGLRYVAAEPVTRAVAIAFFLVGLTAADDVALPFLARTLGAGSAGIGVLYASVGAGLILGYVVLARAGHRIRPAPAFVMGAAVIGVANALTGLASALGVAVAFQLTRGVGTAVLETNLQTLIQRTVPRRMLGRVFANVYGAVNIAAALALLVGGPLLDATSDRTVLVVAGLIGLAAAASSALLLRWQPRLGKRDDAS